jgi:hypothetical protein
VSYLVGHHGAANAGMLGPAFHAGLEERTVDNQLMAAVEQVEQARLALRPFDSCRATRPLRNPYRSLPSAYTRE